MDRYYIYIVTFITFLDKLYYAFITLNNVIVRVKRIEKGKYMNRGKILSGFVALAIYLSIIFMVLFFYNIHKTKAKNYVEKNSNRVTVTLVNSDKTVFNKSAKKSIPNKPVPKIIPHIKKPIVKKHTPKKITPKKITPKKIIPKKIKRATKPIPKPKKVVPKKVVPKKKIPKKVVPKKKLPKKVIPKPPKKKVPVKKVPKKKVPKKTAKDLFSSINAKRPVHKRPKHTQPIKRPSPVKRPSSVKHNMSITDRIKATHQSGRLSNANRDKGIENAYIARVKRHMNNWNPVGMKGQWVTVNLTIYNSGKFRYTTSGVSGAMRESLKRYLDTLNRMGLGRHKKSTPYSIQVRFKVR